MTKKVLSYRVIKIIYIESFYIFFNLRGTVCSGK